MSRSSLARRFTALVGRPPMDYLTWWRMGMAARLLREPDTTLAAVARAVGYASPFAFASSRPTANSSITKNPPATDVFFVSAMNTLMSGGIVMRNACGSTISPTVCENPSPTLLAYATTKGAIANFTAGLAQLIAERGIRVNCVAPGPIWTPLIPSTMPEEAVKSFGQNTPLGRAGQPAELAPAYVMLASGESSYITGALIPVTGGRPML